MDRLKQKDTAHLTHLSATHRDLRPNTTMTTRPSLPPTMRAWAFSTRGHPTSVLRLSSLPTPQPSMLAANEVLIKVSHTSLMLGTTLMFHLLPHYSSTPLVPEIEFCGSIVAFGAGGDKTSECEGQVLEVNDKVVGFLDPRMVWKWNGAVAEYVVCWRNGIARKPEGMGGAEASGLVANGWTAVCGADAAGLKRGQKVLVNGASGGVGSMFVQVARNLVGEEGTVVGVCSGKNEKFVRELGADEVKVL